jgi:hypothetical protein
MAVDLELDRPRTQTITCLDESGAGKTREIGGGNHEMKYKPFIDVVAIVLFFLKILYPRNFDNGG